MDARALRGLEIAAKCKVVHKDGAWVVPSQTDNGTKYTVKPETQQCTCPDHETRNTKCKHLWAVEYVLQRDFGADGTVTETETLQVTKVTKTCPQNWTAYNAAQSEEKARFTVLLTELCQRVPQPPQTNGRPKLPLSDMVFAATYKVYTGFSSRRFSTDVAEAKADGNIGTEPHFNSVSRYLSSPELTPVLKSLVTVSSLPMKAIESQFAVDSSGFSTSRFVRWYNKKYGRELDNREWVKVHLVCGVQTQIVTSADISGWAANDTTYFVPLLEQTAQHFQIAEVSADKAYTSHKNLAAVEAAGGVPFVPFKSNTFPATGDSAWARAYDYFMFNRERFLEHYHRRSLVETTFSMIKAKFGDSVRSKSHTGQANEVLCKVLCHNICVLVQAIHELGLEPAFTSGAQEAVAPIG
ncbi:MAG: transposase [Chloroflexi bacterium]|nr:transposase [Chloroflexota bacterium]